MQRTRVEFVCIFVLDRGLRSVGRAAQAARFFLSGDGKISLAGKFIAARGAMAHSRSGALAAGEIPTWRSDWEF